MILAVFGARAMHRLIALGGFLVFLYTASPAASGEYGQIEETLSPAAMDLMTAWILKHVR